jgi:hypothetical protein
MSDHQIERIPPRRLRLVWIFLGSAVFAAIECGLAIGIVADLLHGREQSPFISLTEFFLLVLCIIVTPYMVLFALWALARQFLPALKLTPHGLVNNTIVYHVVIPWNEIEEFTCIPSHGKRSALPHIILLTKDKRRLSAMQQPLSRLLVLLFRLLVPTNNINCHVTAGPPEIVWERLQAYVQRTLPDLRIKFTSLK